MSEGEEGYIHSTKVDNFLDACGRVLLDCADGCGHLEVSVDDVDTDDDRVFLIEYGNGAQDAGEDCQHLRLFLPLLFELLHVRCELVEQVINDVRLEDLDADLVGIGFGFFVDFDVEAQHDGVLFGLF